MQLEEAILASIREAVRLIRDSQYVTALTGAGVSVKSGIRPFRGPDGIWTEFGEPPMDSYRMFDEDPKRYWEEKLSPSHSRTSSLRDSYKAAKPNAGHFAFAELEAMGILKSLITQNIDNLHTEAGSRRVLEIHGNRMKLRCVMCGERFPTKGFDLTSLPPRCPICGDVVKDDVVVFGEPIPRDVLEACRIEANKSDCIIVAGTSAVVQPAASLPFLVKERGGWVIEVNLLRTELTEFSDVVIRAPSGVAMPAVLDALKSLSIMHARI